MFIRFEYPHVLHWNRDLEMEVNLIPRSEKWYKSFDQIKDKRKLEVKGFDFCYRKRNGG